ncbi:endothelin receptor type B-like [Periplaneta americana]|uniref:endothelin receptor type B-like n=1 Tax=Periplaneta americana TaxID=6978 RepID=UPI0037E7CC40
MFFLIALLLMSVELQAAQTKQPVEAECGFTFKQELCSLDLRQDDQEGLRQEAARTSQCLQQGGRSANRVDRIQRVVEDIRGKLRCQRTDFDDDDKSKKLFCDKELDEIMSEEGDGLKELNCVSCLLAQFDVILNYSGVHECVSQATEMKQKFLTLISLVNITAPNSSPRPPAVWVKHFLDVKRWTKSEYSECNILLLLNEEDYKEIYTHMAKLYPLIIISCFIIAFGLIGNGILIVIFLRHSELRTGTNTMVFNLAFAHMLYLLLTASFMFIPSVGEAFWQFDHRAVSLLILWSVSLGVCVYSAMVICVQRYLAVISMTKSVRSRLRRFSPVLIYVVWIAALIVSVPTALLFMNNPVQKAKIVFLFNFFAHDFIPVVTVATLSAITSRHLRQSVANMPGEGVGQTAVKRRRSRSARVVTVLSVAFTLTYLPGYLMDVVIMFACVPIQDAFVYFAPVGYLVIFLNAFVNPIALYVGSGKFRRYFNIYLCCCPCRKASRKNTISEVVYTSMGDSVRTLTLLAQGT